MLQPTANQVGIEPVSQRNTGHRGARLPAGHNNLPLEIRRVAPPGTLCWIALHGVHLSSWWTLSSRFRSGRSRCLRRTLTNTVSSAKPLWRRIEFYVKQARAQDDMSAVHTVGIDETSLRRGQHYITVVHDLPAKRLLFATEGRDHHAVLEFAQDLKAHGGDPAAVRHACQDMSAAYTKGVGMALPVAAISYDRFHVVKMAIEAMDEVRRSEWRDQPQAVHEALGGADRKVLKGLMWGMRKNPASWSGLQIKAMHWLQHSTLKAARAWRLKMALREVYASAIQHNNMQQAQADLKTWLSWARRSRLEPFKKLARSLSTHFDGVISGMLDNRSNAYVEAMNGLLQQAKRAARGFRTASNFIAIAYLRMARLSHLPAHPFIPASAK